MQDFISLKIIAKSLADSLEPEWGCYIIYNPTLPEMRFNFPVVVYFDREHATGVSHISGEVLRVEYADKDAYPDSLISKIGDWRSVSPVSDQDHLAMTSCGRSLLNQAKKITNKSEEFPADCFQQDCLNYITKNIQ